MAAYDFPDTAGKPTDGSFEYTAPDGTLYEWNGYAWVVPSGDDAGSGGGGAARVLTQVLPPSPAQDGDMYWCTDDGRLYLYYDDADTSQWVDASPDGGGSSGSPVETYWDRNGTTLSPANDGDSVEVDGSVRILDGTHWLTRNLAKAANLTARQYGGSDGLGKIEYLDGTTLIGGDLDQNTGSNAPNITLNANGSATFAGEIVSSRLVANGSFPIRVYAGKSGINGSINNNCYLNVLNEDVMKSMFYVNADGSAYFAGTVTAAGHVFNLEADDPANYTTTIVDGEETQVYNGPTLDVKALLLTLQTAATRIATLEAKVATLESDHTTLMNNNNGGGY